MDPDETLEELRAMVRVVEKGEDSEGRKIEAAEWEGIAELMAEKVQALDGWLSKGGFLPSDWHEDTDRPDSKD